jgi:hypothetical protein
MGTRGVCPTTFITRILVKNNVVPLVLGDYVIAGK